MVSPSAVNFQISLSEALLDEPGLGQQPAAEGGAGEVVSGPRWFPRLEKSPAPGPQLAPFGEVRGARRPQPHPLALDAKAALRRDPVQQGHASNRRVNRAGVKRA